MESTPPWRFSSTVPTCLALGRKNFSTFSANLWLIVCKSLFRHHLLCYHGNTFIEQWLNKNHKNDKNSIIFINLIWLGKIDFKYEISVSELTAPPNFGFPSNIGNLVKSWTLTPKRKNYIMTGNQWWCPILLWFWRQFRTYLHSTKFCSN